MDENNPINSEGRDLSISNSVFSDWGSIISQLHTSLPAIDSDSESSIAEEDITINGISVFQRNIQSKCSVESESEKLSLGSPTSSHILDDQVEDNEPITNASEGYASGSSSSSNSNAFISTTKETKHITQNGVSSDSTVNSSALLFQRLLNSSALSCNTQKDDLHLSDLDLDPPIYGDHDNGNYLSSSSDKSMNSPLPMDMQTFQQTETFTNTWLSPGEIADISAIKSAPVLSLGALEGFDFEDILETQNFDRNERMSSSDDVSLNEDKTEVLMAHLRDLSAVQCGDNTRKRGPIGSFLEDTSLDEEPDGFDKEFTEPMEKDSRYSPSRYSPFKVKSVSSCGVTANLSAITGLSMSEPTTVYIDLRPDKVCNTDKQDKTVEPEVHPFKVTRFDVKAKHARISQTKNRPISKMRVSETNNQTGSASDSGDDDDSFEEWKRLRNRIKSRSTATAKTKATRSKKLEPLTIAGTQISETDTAPSENIETSKVGNYESTRLKNETDEKTIKSNIASKDSKQSKTTNKSKVTVTFAEEPKKSADDVDNVYRSKKMQPKPVKMSTNFSQTDEIPTIPRKSLIETVNERLSIETEKLLNQTALLTSNKSNKKGSNNKLTSEIDNLYLSLKGIHDSGSQSNKRQQQKNQTDVQYSGRESKLKVEKKIIEINEQLKNNKNRPTMLFDIETSFDDSIPVIPPGVDIDNHSQLVLLTVNLSSPGCIITHKATGNKKQTPIDISDGFSITFSMLISWLLALVPDNMKHLIDVRSDGMFNIDYSIENDLGGGGARRNNKCLYLDDETTSPFAVEVPFNVVSLQQIWMEDVQSLSLQAVVIPNMFYKADAKGRGRKKIKKEDMFMQSVWQFLQSNRLQDVCPWHNRASSPIYYTLADMRPIYYTCATKPLSCFVSTSNDPMQLKNALQSNSGYMWKVLPCDETLSSNITSDTNKHEVTTCLLQKDALMYPTAVMDVIIRIQTMCCDITGIKLAFPTRGFINKNTLYQNPYDMEDLEEITPCVVFAIRGRSAIAKWSNIVGPRDHILARHKDKDSLNAQYGPQLCEMRKLKEIPKDLNQFCYPRSGTRAQQQLCTWFGGRIDFTDNLFNSPDKTSQKQSNRKGKNGKGKSKNNSNNSTKDKKSATQMDFATSKILSAPSLLVCCPLTRIYLVISPRLPIRFIGDVLEITTNHGFIVEGIRRVRLNERKASSLLISQRMYPFYCPSIRNDITVEMDYYEMDNWWMQPSTVILLGKENAQCHQAALLYAFQSELLYGATSPSDGVRECFHICNFSDSIEHSIGTLTKIPEVQLITGESPRSFFSNPEMEQIIVLSLVGNKAVDFAGKTLRTLLHGDFHSPSAGFITTNDDELDLNIPPEEFRGFEMLGIKWLHSLNSLQAKELTPFEVGTRRWHDSIPIIESSPVIICVLRRINAFQVLEEALDIGNLSSYSDGVVSLNDIKFIMSQTPEIAYRQIRMFFADKELFADNLCRPLLKFLPSPCRVHQYKLLQDNPSMDATDHHGNKHEPLSTTSNSKSKRKKKNGKNKDINNNANSNVTSPPPLYIQEESIFQSIVTEQEPLSSVIVIKPDAFPRHFIKLLRNINQEGFHIVASKLIRMTEDQAMQLLPKEFIDKHGERQVFLDHMTSDASLVMCLQRTNAVRRLCELAGPSDPCTARRKQQKQFGNSLYPLQSAVWNNGIGCWRAVYGIDNISNGIHVSESYNSAMEELKRFFPEGLCCEETVELNMELIPTPASDPIMDIDKMKGREAQFVHDNVLTTTTSNIIFQRSPPQQQAIVLILGPNLFSSNNAKRRSLRNNKLHKTNNIVPAYLLILEQLVAQGFEICALRMVWFKQYQAKQALEFIGAIKTNGDSGQQKAQELSNGPSMVLLLQRENALVLFDSILGSTQSRGDSLYHKHSHEIIRSQTPSQTEKSALYLFNRVANSHSVLQIGHKKALEWRERTDVIDAMSTINK